MQTNDVRMLNLRRDGECGCGAFLPRGTRAGWHRSLRIVLCARCVGTADDPVPVDVGVPGGSLDREFDRRVARREADVRRRHPHLGGLILRLSSTSRTTDAFRIGAVGEREAAEHLTRAAGPEVLFLFNRRRGTGRERGDIDVLAIAPSGVHVIDPKKYVGRRVRADRRGEIFIVDRRRRPSLTTSMRRQVDAVSAAILVGPQPQATVQGAYCFIGADLPWRPLVVDGVHALGLKGVTRRLAEPGPLDAAARAELHVDLARRFPPA